MAPRIWLITVIGVRCNIQREAGSGSIRVQEVALGRSGPNAKYLST